MQRWQVVFLVVLAAAVAFAAVAGAARLADWLLGGPKEQRKEGYLALLAFGQGEQGGSPSAVLALREQGDRGMTLYTIPRSLLLEGPGGEYVLAGDMLEAGELEGDLERLIDAEIDFAYDLPYSSLAVMAARDAVWAKLDDPAELEVDGARRGYKGRFSVPSSQVGALLAAPGASGEDESAMQDALMRAVLDSAALQPRADRARLVDQVVTDARGSDRSYLREILTDATSGSVEVRRLPSNGKTALGQFAYRPDPDEIMAQITRRAPGFAAPVTVLVRNGSGELGVGDAVIARLSVLDVNLPGSANADSFKYRRTQILAGSETLPVAQDIRAILGRGVVLDGSRLGPTTVMVIVGRDLKAKDLQ